MLPDTLYERAYLLDSGALIALQDPTDQWHQEANECLREIARRGAPVIVIVAVIAETHRRLLHKQGAAEAKRFLDSIYDGTVNVLRAGKADEDDAATIVGRYLDAGISYTDALSMAVMKRERIGSAFTFDHHFSVVGFNKVPPLAPRT